MNRAASVLAALLVTAAAGAAFGQGGGRGNFGNLPLVVNDAFYSGEYFLMLQELTLTDQQKPKVRAKVEAMNTELQAFIRNSQAEFGGGVPNRGTVGVPLAELKFQEGYQLIADNHQIKIDAELTNDQKIQWETYKLHRLLDERLGWVNLTDDQTEKVKALMEETATAIIALPDGKDLQTLQGRLIRKLVSDVLTEPQAVKLIDSASSSANGNRGGNSGPTGGFGQGVNDFGNNGTGGPGGRGRGRRGG